jgi:transcriptional regulator of heat shock response
VEESKPIGSNYLCEKYHLGYSPATVRLVMETLEEKNYLSHPHTSSGRIPTQKGFTLYVECLKEEEMVHKYPVEFTIPANCGFNEVLSDTLDFLAKASGCISLAAIFGKNKRFVSRGARFMLEQPEFEDIVKLKQLFYALDVKIGELEYLLFHCADEHVKILIGDEIGCDEISNCSLVLLGEKEQGISFSLGLLGPMRMNYEKAASYIYGIKNQLKSLVGEL